MASYNRTTASDRGKAIIDIPSNAPTIGTATDLAADGQVSVTFTAPSTTVGGPITSYKALSDPSSIVGTGTTSPITVTGLTNDTSYTFTVAAVNSTGNGPYSAASNSVTPTVPPSAYQHIATVTATGSETTFTFSSIPGTYDHLQIRGIVQRSASTNVGIQCLNINGSTTAADYSMHLTYGRAPASPPAVNTEIANSSTYTQARSVYVPGSNIANDFGWVIIDITGYAETTKTKAVRTVGGFTYNGTAYDGYYGHLGFASNYYNSTSAITSLTVTLAGDTFSSGSTYSLYGIKGS